MAYTLTIQHGDKIYYPIVKDEIKLTQERSGAPSQLSFTVIKDSNIDFHEGDRVCFYYDDTPVFMGYVFTKKRDRKHHIEVTAYDQLRYFKNKFTYVFSKKSATDIIKLLCADFSLNTGNIADTKYTIPSLVEENQTLFDIALDALDETLLNSGNMYVLYDDFGKINLTSLEDMVVNIVVDEDTAENFNYTSTIDKETYNKIVLYYDPNDTTSSSSGNNTSTTGDVQKVLQTAANEIGTAENPSNSNNVKYNTEYYGREVSGSSYPWCCVFIWWIFKHSGLSNLFYNGGKTASCGVLMDFYKSKGQFVTGNYKAGDIVFYDWGSDGRPEHVGIVESVTNTGTVIAIEGNYSNKVGRVNRSTSLIIGAGRPSYSNTSVATLEASGSSGGVENTTSKEEVATNDTGAYQIYYAKDDTNINKWGLLQYFESVSNPSIGQSKADALLKLYNRKTKELTISKAFGNPKVRGGSLIIVKLNLGDVVTYNYMLVEKVTHTFKNDYYTMDLTLNGYWED